MTRRIIGVVQVILGISVLAYMLVYGTTKAVTTVAVFLAVASAILEFALFHHERQAARRGTGN